MAIHRRYKQKVFKDFVGGAGQKILNDSNKFSKSSGFTYNENEEIIELQVDFNQKTKDGFLDFYPHYTQKSSPADGYLMYALAFSNSVSDYGVKVYIVGTDGNHYLTETFQGVEEFTCAFNFNNLFIVQFFDSNLSKIVLKITADHGQTWSSIESPFEYYLSHVVVNDILYVTDGGSIYFTKDGITWETFYVPASDNEPGIIQLEFYRGFLHFIGKKGQTYSLGYFSADEKTIIRQWHDISFFGAQGSFIDFVTTDDALVLMIIRGSILYTYSWDFDVFTLENQIVIDNETTAVKILGYSNQKIFFILEINNKLATHIFLLNSKYSFFDIYNEFFYTIPNKYFIYNYVNFNNVDYFFAFNDDEDDIIIMTADTDNYFPWQNDINLITSIFKSESTCVPKQLILKHDPLPEFAVIKIYVARNEDAFTNTFDTLLITNSVKDSIRTNFDCPSDVEFDSVSFKIVIEPLNLEEDQYYESSPKNIELILLYKEIGLEVST